MDIDSPEGREALYRIFRDHQVGLCVNSAAHDINNMLGAIASYVELIETTEQPPAESSRMMGRIAEAARRCSALVQSLTDIARRERPDRSMLNVGPFVERTLDLVRNDFRNARVSLEFNNTAAERAIAVYAQKLQFAILYLMTNAREAAAGTEDAVVRVTVASREDSVTISVWNSGPAVSEADRESMFEPFFTTKGTGHLGLGLTLARTIAREHDGDLTYDKAKGFALGLRT